jgi:hypothetical protein
MADLPIDEYIAALEKMKKGRRDRVGVLGELGVTGLAAVAGGFLAWFFGACSFITIFGYTIFVVSNPIGWIVGGATAVGALGYVLARFVRGGGKYDALKKVSIRELEERIQLLRKKARWSVRTEPKVRKIIDSLELLVANGHMSQDTATGLLGAIEKNHLRPREAFDQIQALIEEKASLLSASH